MDVNLSNRPVSVSMASIGSKACVSCNSEYAELEGSAKTAFVNIRDGKNLTADEIEVFLDWLDKVRIGMWLWGVDIFHKKDAIRPKFTIGDRIGLKDRIVAITVYPKEKAGSGLAFWGVTDSFLHTPSAFGLFANNIAIVTISYDYLLLQHGLDTSIPMGLYDQDPTEAKIRGGDTRFDFELSVPLKERLHLLGHSRIYGQIIAAESLADEFIALGINEPSRHPGYRKTKIFSLNDSLNRTDLELSKIMTTENINDVILMEANVHIASEYIIKKILRSDFETIIDAALRHRTVEGFNENLFFEKLAIAALKDKYYRQVGIVIP